MIQVIKKQVIKDILGSDPRDLPLWAEILIIRRTRAKRFLGPHKIITTAEENYWKSVISLLHFNGRLIDLHIEKVMNYFKNLKILTSGIFWGGAVIQRGPSWNCSARVEPAERYSSSKYFQDSWYLLDPWSILTITKRRRNWEMQKTMEQRNVISRAIANFIDMLMLC